jgi:hypothetical protein
MTDNIFNRNLLQLENLFGSAIISEKKKRLFEISNNTEESWQKNVERLSNKKVDHILIAEAAPWSDGGVPRYFYNKMESSYHKKIWRAFFPYNEIPADDETAFGMLADKSFLLIDTLPFSMSYKGRRDRNAYFEIISNSLEWWIEKLNNSKLKLSQQVNIAFAFKVNGLKVINATGGQLKLKDRQTIRLTENLIAADGSGYTSSEKLRTIYKL